MGPEVGVSVGNSVGIFVGDAVGAEVGAEVGSEVGSEVGALVGFEVGADVWGVGSSSLQIAGLQVQISGNSVLTDAQAAALSKGPLVIPYDSRVATSCSCSQVIRDPHE